MVTCVIGWEEHSGQSAVVQPLSFTALAFSLTSQCLCHTHSTLTQATTREQSWCCGCVAMCAHHSHPARNKSVPPQSVSLLLGGAACIPKNATLACPSGALILATVPVRGLTRNKHHVQPRSPRKQPEEGQNPQMGSLQSAPDLSGCHAPASVCIVYISWELMPLGKDSVNPR